MSHETQNLASYQFGSLTFAETRSVMLAVENLGEQDAVMTSLAVKDAAGTAVTAFAYTGGTYPGTGGDCEATIKSKTECSIDITFTAPTGTAYSSTAVSGTATITYNNGVEAATTTFELAGTSRKCANGSGLAIDQLVYDSGSAASVTSETQLVAQSFGFADSKLIKKINLSQYKGVGATFTGVRIAFYADASNAPTGAPLASFDFSDPGIILSSRSSFTYSLSSPFEAAANSNYWMVISYPGLAGGLMYTDRETSNATSFGNYAFSADGTSWSANTSIDLTHSIETCLADTVVAESATYTE